MKKTDTIINLDPIDRKNRQKKGLIARFLITRFYGGQRIKPMDKFGHYMFCGSQGSGKSTSNIFFLENRIKFYKKHCIYNQDDSFSTLIKYKTPPKIKVYSNMGFGYPINKFNLFETINEFSTNENVVRFILIDEIQSYFPKGTIDKETRKIMDNLIGIFSQLRKRNTYIISTAQVYGRLDKSLREQCLYMINCSVSFSHRLVNEFILGDDIICDELGRWSGDPKFIFNHGLQKTKYNTKKIIF